jgi:hypothetical protein
MAENLSETGHPRDEERLRVGPIIRDVIIIWVLTYMGGFVIGFAFAGLPDAKTRAVGAYAVANFLFGTLGFYHRGLFGSSQEMESPRCRGNRSLVHGSHQCHVLPYQHPSMDWRSDILGHHYDFGGCAFEFSQESD